MTDNGWRTLCVRSRARIGFSEGSLTVCGDDKNDFSFPLTQLRCVMIESQESSISSRALAELAAAGVRLVVCDERHDPVLEGVPCGVHSFSAGRLARQAAWGEERKALLWREIVRRKLRMQAAVLAMTVPTRSAELEALADRVTPGDSGRCEAQGARLYFRALFGGGFTREAGCAENSALNYGYAILRSLVNRSVSAFGYRAELGVHHIGETNPFNLSCDLMEPFRPLIDTVVLTLDLSEEGLTAENRDALIRWQYDAVRYDGRRYSACDAIECFVKNCLDYLNGEGDMIGEVGLYD